MRTSLVLLSLLAACTDADPDAPTWHGDVAPIVQEHCAACHTAGNIAPFVLDSYEDALPMSQALLQAVERGDMPPWFAVETDECDPVLPFEGDMRLSDEEIETLRLWVEAGSPEGDPDDAAPLPEAPSLELTNPDLSLEWSSPYLVKSGTQDEFMCFVLDPGNTETMWVSEVQLLPGNTAVDHHGLVYVDVEGVADDLATDGSFPCFGNPGVDGYLLGTWTPGAAPTRVPENTGMPLPGGARLVVQMHYHPDLEEDQIDESVVQLKWTEEEPEWAAAQALLGNDWKQSSDGTGLQPGPNDDGEPVFIIPAGEANHVEEMLYTQEIPIEFPLFSVGTHMHYVGTDMKITLEKEGEPTCLVQTPNWDFNWQRVYNFDAPIDELPTIGQGDSLRMRCTFDNSLGNPFVADALREQGLDEPVDVALGEETLDEMCLGLFGILVPPGLVDQLF